MQASLFFLLKPVVQPTQRSCFYRMAECLSGRVMMPLEIRGPQNCCTSSMMLSGMWVGPLLQIFLQCPEETIKWVLLPQLLLLHVLFSEELGWDRVFSLLLFESRLLKILLYCKCFFFFFLLDYQKGRKDPNPWQTALTAFLLLNGDWKCRLNFIL